MRCPLNIRGSRFDLSAATAQPVELHGVSTVKTGHVGPLELKEVSKVNINPM